MGEAKPFLGTEAVGNGALTYRDLRRQVRVYRNVYMPRGAELTASDRAMAAWLWSDKAAVIAGSSAAALLGAKWVDAAAPAELITDRTRPPARIITRNETLLSGETVSLAGVPVTSPARTAYDIGRRPGIQTAVMRLDALARATGVTVADVLPLMPRAPRRAWHEAAAACACSVDGVPLVAERIWSLRRVSGNSGGW